MNGYAAQINRLMDLTAYFTARIKQTPGYELIIDPVGAAAQYSKHRT